MSTFLWSLAGGIAAGGSRGRAAEPAGEDGAEKHEGQSEGPSAETKTPGEAGDRDAADEKGGRSPQGSLPERDGRDAVHRRGDGEPLLKKDPKTTRHIYTDAHKEVSQSVARLERTSRGRCMYVVD